MTDRSDLTRLSKPVDQRCRFCLIDGVCDVVAMDMGWCGAMKLLAAIEETRGGDD